MQRILVVDDDQLQLDVVSFLSRRAGWETSAAVDAVTARRLFVEQQPDLVILDIHLGDEDGLDLLRQFRKERPAVAILMLTALAAEDDRVRGLELGADDYLCKPFGHRELIARVRALLRRGPGGPRTPARPGRIELGAMALDPMAHRVTHGGQPVDLTPTEFRLLQALMLRPCTLVPLQTLLHEVWGHQDLSAKNVVRVTANHLRAKLDAARASGWLQTVRGEGLILCEKEPKRAVTRSAPTEAPVALDVIADLQALVEGSGMQPLQELNQVYTRTAARHLSAIRDSVARHDARIVAEEAHKLRGASASLGAQRVSRLCAVIEEQSRAGDITHIDELLTQVESELAAFEDALAPLLVRPS
jgi:DNA-binding response OmpR family regulator/HPt (histidine-containing phosphotransfer) domain-containing protein